MKKDPGFIDVNEMRRRVSVDEFNLAAEAYCGRIQNWDYHLAKPFGSVSEAPELLICLAQVLMGLRLAPEMTIVDFGAGSCWASRCLTQLGLQVISIDASATALKIGKALYEKLPIIGSQPTPQFLVFDGYTIDLPDASIDRIICLEALHHVPNPEHVIREMGRVLSPGGIAGFSEPGPTHSQQSQSQYEMRMHGVLENDIHLDQIWQWAQSAGFVDMKVALFNASPFYASLFEFADYRQDGPLAEDVKRRSASAQQEYLNFRSLFFLSKVGTQELDSRQRSGLTARLDLKISGNEGPVGGRLLVQGTVNNNGDAIWLPASAKIGGVKLGVHLLDQDGKTVDQDYFRQHLTPDPGRRVGIGETVTMEFQIPLPQARGRYFLEFDLVSEGVAWFETNGSSQPVRIAIRVI
jgi:SAM-dependent methyltransferase